MTFKIFIYKLEKFTYIEQRIESLANNSKRLLTCDLY